MDSSHLFPSAEDAMSIHLRLCDLDPVATVDLCSAFLQPLIHWLETMFPRVDPDFRQSAAGQALLEYLKDPHAFRPERGSLPAYLCMAARGDLSNLLRGEKRHQRHRVPWSVVELGEESGNILGRDQVPSRRLEDSEEEKRWQVVVQAVRDRCTDSERQVLDLMLAGERNTPAYAAALGITGLPAAAQEREVKRVKDRIKKRLEREGARHD
jgi:hypothetical protein